MECLKPATELKLVSRGNEFQAFTTRSLKKLDRAQGLLRLLNNLKLCSRNVFNKTELKEIINWHVNNTKQNFVAPDQIDPETS